MESCLKCGGQVPSGAKYCATCGAPRGNAAPHEGAPAAVRHHSLSLMWVGITVVAFALGGSLSALILRPAPKRSPAKQAVSRAPAKSPNAAMAGLPPGHPHVNLPAGHPSLPNTSQVSAIVIEAEKQAAKQPDDIAAWNRYGDLAMRFAMFNPANYQKAHNAFDHVLQLDPDNSDALRGIGDVYYDTRQYAKAIDAYNRYLRGNPDDSRVLTDLGTMYLSQHNGVEAIKEYRMALARKSDFFPAQFNLVVAYLLIKDKTHARDALLKARVIAPDGAARTRIDEMIATVDEHKALTDSSPSTGAEWTPSSAQTLPQ